MAAVDEARHLINQILRQLRHTRDVLAIVGLVYASRTVLKLAWTVVGGLRTHLFSVVCPVDINKYGKWAVVTGCTDGIGKAYCHELAKRGMSIVLISRNTDKLRRTARELEVSYNVETYIVEADFGQGRRVYSRIAEEILDKDIGVLVNNVGIMYEYPMLFDELSEETAWQHILLNVGAVTAMTRMVLPKMLARGRGAIINMSSSSAIYPLPMMAIYSATKAYVDYFTRAIQHEYQGRGIEIQCIMPFYVSTAMTKFSGTLHQLKLFVPDAGTFVKHALATLGHSRRTTGHWSHGIQYVLFGSVPEWVWLRLGCLLQRYLRYDADRTKQKMLAGAAMPDLT